MTPEPDESALSYPLLTRTDALRAVFATESEREVAWESIASDYGEGVRVAAASAFRDGWDRCILALIPMTTQGQDQ